MVDTFNDEVFNYYLEQKGTQYRRSFFVAVPFLSDGGLRHLFFISVQTG